ncbi:hypothetical protein GCM10022225_83580 [Plantactinospora mayteni]|uniref:Nitroreductase domain-containing protein n=1 Tax=Plantactinospora mayteni TaxID=566021 RepID=A0ABQ4F4I0_9ACTN|nr:nitroreductase family protein [Plantactinospora mayteni]GIH01812.1 hypothetical protein Pma05_83840 [Plantactinospora mayteni]
MPLIREDEFTETVDRLVRTRTPLPPGPAGPFWDVDTGAGRPPVDGTVPLEQVLRGRLSVREFSPEPLPREALTAVLGLAEHSYRTRRVPAGSGAVPLTMLLALHRVQDVRPGLYRPEASGEYPEPVRSRPSVHWPRIFADAPVLVFIGGSVLTTPAGAYGELLVQAGALGYTIWLAARSHGLDCSVFGQPDHLVTKAMRWEEPAARHLFTVALGRRLVGDAAPTRPE